MQITTKFCRNLPFSTSTITLKGVNKLKNSLYKDNPFILREILGNSKEDKLKASTILLYNKNKMPGY